MHDRLRRKCYELPDDRGDRRVIGEGRNLAILDAEIQWMKIEAQSKQPAIRFEGMAGECLWGCACWVVVPYKGIRGPDEKLEAAAAE